MNAKHTANMSEYAAEMNDLAAQLQRDMRLGGTIHNQESREVHDRIAFLNSEYADKLRWTKPPEGLTQPQLLQWLINTINAA